MPVPEYTPRQCGIDKGLRKGNAIAYWTGHQPEAQARDNALPSLALRVSVWTAARHCSVAIKHAAIATLILAVLGGLWVTNVRVQADLGDLQTKPAKTSFKFQFGPGKTAPGYIQVAPGTAFSKELGYGFDFGPKLSAIDRGGDNLLHAGFCTSEQPFYFSVDLPEGNYDVTVTMGDLKGESIADVRAESRRLMLENVLTGPGKFETRTFTTNIRNSNLASGGHVNLKDREIGVLHWDDKLTVEFRGQRPCLCALEIAKNDTAVTVYLAGDSTVTDQVQKNETFTSWGQMLPRFFKPKVVSIANHAESGEATTSFIGAKRLDKILDTMKKGDYLFIQFGHNDQNQKRDIATYKKTLQRFIAEARKREAIPVLLTPMRRRVFDAAGNATNNLGEYPEAVRQTAKQEDVTLIDLHVMCKDFYEALGPENSKLAFVEKDNTHNNVYGAYEVARMIAEAIRKSGLGLAKYIVDDLPPANIKKGVQS
jgi:lysophospholipase L1-like esterase